MLSYIRYVVCLAICSTRGDPTIPILCRLTAAHSPHTVSNTAGKDSVAKIKLEESTQYVITSRGSPSRIPIS